MKEITETVRCSRLGRQPASGGRAPRRIPSWETHWGDTLRKYSVLLEDLLKVGGLKPSCLWNKERFELDCRCLCTAQLLCFGQRSLQGRGGVLGACDFPHGQSVDCCAGWSLGCVIKLY